MDAEIIAHRGSSFLAPENTLAAVQLAWQEGADAVEGDFRLTADGHIVCIHDANLKRTTGVDRGVAECSLAELQTYDAGSFKGLQFAGQRIATLEEILATVPLGKRLFVEVKCGVEIVDPLRRVVGNCALDPQQIVPISLRLDVCQQVKMALPDCLVYWVIEFKRDAAGEWEPILDELIPAARASHLDGLDLTATGPIDAERVKRIKSAGLALYVWTVDDPQQARRLIDQGVQGITTNRPGWLREQLRG